MIRLCLGLGLDLVLVGTLIGQSLNYNGRAYWNLPWFYNISLHVDFDQTGGSDLVVKHSKWIQQKFFSVLTQAHLNKKN